LYIPANLLYHRDQTINTIRRKKGIPRDIGRKLGREGETSTGKCNIPRFIDHHYENYGGYQRKGGLGEGGAERRSDQGCSQAFVVYPQIKTTQ